MNNETRLYDLLLFGTTLQGAERMDAINTLAKMLKTSSGKVELMLEKKSVVLLKRVSADVVKKYERKLTAIGFKCNTRPCNESGADLELVPLEKMQHTLGCPACGHVHKFAEGEDEPDVCASCNVVFAKYSDNLKLEREKIKRALLAKSQLAEKAQQEEKQRLQEEARRRRLEEEIRKELGLPRFVTRRKALISSATAIFAFGLILGVGGVVAYDSLNELDEEPYPMSTQAAFPGTLAGEENIQALNTIPNTSPTQILANLPPEAIASLDPAMLTHMQVTGMLDGQTEPAVGPLTSITAGAETVQVISDVQEAGPSAGIGDNSLIAVGDELQLTFNGRTDLPATSTKAGDALSQAGTSSSEFVRKMFDDLGSDPEWDAHLLRQVYELTVKNRTESGLALMGLIHDQRLLMEGGAKLAVWLAARDRMPESDQVFEYLLQRIETLPEDNRLRVEALHSIARSQAKIPGKALIAEATAMKARVIAESASAPCDQAKTSAEVFAMLSNLGIDKAARIAHQHSHEGLRRIDGQRELLTCLGFVVKSYLRAGDRGGALVLLQDMAKGGKALELPNERDLVLQQASQLYRELGDMQAATELAGAIADPLVRNDTLYANVSDQLSNGNIGAAMTAIEVIQSPFSRARAYAMLGLSQAQDPAYLKLAEESFKQAHEVAISLANPLEKMVISAESARFASRAGRQPEADSGFADALHLFEQLPDAEYRDQALAILATNQSRALRLVEAREQLLKIRDATIAQVTSEKLADSEQLLKVTNEQAGL